MCSMNCGDILPSEDVLFTPTLEFLYARKLKPNNSNHAVERWKVILYDGQHYIIGVCSSSMSKYFQANILRTGTVFKLLDFVMLDTKVSKGSKKTKVCALLDLAPFMQNTIKHNIGKARDINKDVATADLRKEGPYENKDCPLCSHPRLWIPDIVLYSNNGFAHDSNEKCSKLLTLYDEAGTVECDEDTNIGSVESVYDMYHDLIRSQTQTSQAIAQ